LFGLYPREQTPAIPPGSCCSGNSSTNVLVTRAIVIPLSIVHAMNPRRPVPAGLRTLDELLLEGSPLAFPNDEGFF